MSEGVQIREAGASDLQEIVALQRATAMAPQWSEEIWRGLLRGSAEEASAVRVGLVAYRAGVLCGFVAGVCVAGVAEIESIAVAEAARRQGLGARLVQSLGEWAKKMHGASVLELEVRESNAGARSFYASLGFREQGRRSRYYSEPQEDAVLLKLDLLHVG